VATAYLAENKALRSLRTVFTKKYLERSQVKDFCSRFRNFSADVSVRDQRMSSQSTDVLMCADEESQSPTILHYSCDTNDRDGSQDFMRRNHMELEDTRVSRYASRNEERTDRNDMEITHSSVDQSTDNDLYEPIRRMRLSAPPKRFYRSFWILAARRLIQRELDQLFIMLRGDKPRV
jgi:hypothetical protein